MAILHEGRFEPIGQNRVPGYSVFLAIVFGIFDSDSLSALKYIQHIFMVLISLAVFRIGEELDETKLLAFVAGMLSVFMLQLQSYARIPMSEVPFSLLFIYGTWLFLRYLKKDRIVDFCFSVLLFSVATLFKATSQLVPLMMMAIPAGRLIFPNWRYLRVSGKNGQPFRQVLVICLGLFIFVSTLIPWMLFNQRTYGMFGLTGTLGLNLYSNTVQYGIFWDEDSAALKDIRKRWTEVTPEQERNGVAKAEGNHWSYHWPAISRYMAATGFKMHEADKVFLQAAVDAIVEHPFKYFVRVVDNLWGDLTYPEGTYLYLPGLKVGEDKPFYLRHMIPLENNRQVKEVIYDWMKFSNYMAPEVIKFTPENTLTSVYGALATNYHSLMARRYQIALILFIGCLAVLSKASREKGLPWLVLFSLFAYFILLVAAVVPASPRHRLPIDPIISLIYATGILAIIKVILAGFKLHLEGRRLTELVGDEINYESSPKHSDIARGIWEKCSVFVVSRMPEKANLYVHLFVFLFGLFAAMALNSITILIIVILFGVAIIL